MAHRGKFIGPFWMMKRIPGVKKVARIFFFLLVLLPLLLS